MDETSELISIGTLAKRTGLSVLRIRSWENRFKYPQAVKLPSGHRRYNLEEVHKCILLQQALEKGQRISQLIHLSNEELHQIIAIQAPSAIQLSPSKVPQDYRINWEKLWASIKNADELGLYNKIEKIWQNYNLEGFIEFFSIPFLQRLGEFWENDFLDVAQEHFASQVFLSFLEEKWRPKNRQLLGKPFILSLLPHEDHGFGLQLCALYFVEKGQKILYLGRRTPVDALSLSHRRYQSKGIVLSISGISSPILNRKYLQQILDKVEAHSLILIGGKGGVHMEGVHCLNSIFELNQWIDTV